MFCENCGTKVEDAAAAAGTCPNCGAALRQAAPPPTGGFSAPMQPPSGPQGRRSMSRATKYILLSLAALVVVIAAVVVVVVLFTGKGPADTVKGFVSSVSSNRMADADAKWLLSDDFKDFQSDLNDSSFSIRDFKINSVNTAPNQKVVNPAFKQKYYSDSYEPTGDLDSQGSDLDSTKDDLDYTKSDLDDFTTYYPTPTPAEQAEYNQNKAQYDSDLKKYDADLAAWQAQVDVATKKWEAEKASYEKELAQNTKLVPSVGVNATLYGSEDGDSTSKTLIFKMVKYGGGWKIYSYNES